jgi:hypothetical protein
MLRMTRRKCLTIPRKVLTSPVASQCNSARNLLRAQSEEFPCDTVLPTKAVQSAKSINKMPGPGGLPFFGTFFKYKTGLFWSSATDFDALIYH